MPVPTTSIHAYTSPTEFPSPVWQAQESNPQSANIILPHALKHLAREQAGEPRVPGQFWITSGSYEDIDFILACTEGPLGSYPIFLYATRPFKALTSAYALPHLRGLVKRLVEVVPIHRVFSVFGPEPVTRLFVQLWTEHTGVDAYVDYYFAKLTYCTLESLVSDRRMTCLPDLHFELRPAKESDLARVASLCYKFAAESDPFFLTEDKAMEEAIICLKNGQLWVHAIGRPGAEMEIASIVVTSRESSTVSTISKVFTNPEWRERGCARRLVRYVCNYLLTKAAKKSVVLYVANDNGAAATVYHRVGFVGLCENAGPVEGVDQWVEVGFDRSKVKLGHW